MKVLESIKKFFDTGSRVKVLTILQMESVECGAASLAMILAYYGKWIPLEKLRQECGVNRDGSNAENFRKEGHRYNIFKTLADRQCQSDCVSKGSNLSKRAERRSFKRS